VDAGRADRPRATILGSFLEGWRRVLDAPWITCGLLAVMLGLASAQRASLSAGVVGYPEANAAVIERMADQAVALRRITEGVGWMFVHEAFGFGGRTIDVAVNIILDESVGPVPVAYSAVSATALIWLFLSGGILDRLARARPVGTPAFFAASGEYFVRFLRLGVVLGFAYFIVFAWVYPYLVSGLYANWTADVGPARDARVPWVALNATFLLLLVGVGIIADFAKVRSVVEDRRSMLGALAASVRFTRRRPLRIVLLYMLNAVVMLAIVLTWLSFRGRLAWTLLDVSVTTLLLIWTRLAFMASEVVFFQRELAHATYTAAPLPIWPDSPAAEAIENLALARQKAEGTRQK